MSYISFTINITLFKLQGIVDRTFSKQSCRWLIEERFWATKIAAWLFADKPLFLKNPNAKKRELTRLRLPSHGLKTKIGGYAKTLKLLDTAFLEALDNFGVCTYILPSEIVPRKYSPPL